MGYLSRSIALRSTGCHPTRAKVDFPISPACCLGSDSSENMPNVRDVSHTSFSPGSGSAGWGIAWPAEVTKKHFPAQFSISFDYQLAQKKQEALPFLRFHFNFSSSSSSSSLSSSSAQSKTRGATL